MGLPIDRLVIATNDNDILARTLATGEYATREVVATTSPSMDIQVSSNFERLLYFASGRNADEIRRYMQMLKQSGSFTVEPETLEVIRKGFSAGRSEMAETAQTIGAVRRESGYLLDPHTATGVKVARAMRGIGVAHGGSVDRPSGQVPGCRQGCQRHRAGPARMARRPDETQRVLYSPSLRFKNAAGSHKPPRQSGTLSSFKE